MLRDYKGMIIAAGRGTRMGSAETGRNKCLSEINGKSLLQHTVEKFRSKNVKEIIIGTGFDQATVEGQLAGQATFAFNPRFATTGVLQTVWHAREHLRDHAFIFTTGDQYFDRSVLDLFDHFTGDVGLVFDKKQVDSHDTKAMFVDGRWTFGPDLPADKVVGELTGMMIFSKSASAKFFAMLEERISTINQQYVYNLLMVLQDQGLNITPLYCQPDTRIEIDYPEELVKARRMDIR